MSELIKAFRQKIDELECEIKILKLKCLKLAEQIANLKEENRRLQEDKADLLEKILYLEAYKNGI